MPLSISNNAGSGSWIRYSAQMNTWTKSVEGGSEEFTIGPIAIDVERLELGWLLLAPGVREWAPWPDNKKTPQPSPEHRVGVRVLCYGPKTLGSSDAYELCSNAVGVTQWIERVYNEAEKGFGKGEIPIVEVTGAKAIKVGKGQTRELSYKIAKWIPRPACMEGEGAPEAEPAPAKKSQEESLEF